MTKNNDTALLPIPKNREIWTFSEAEKLCAWYSENFETISLVLHNTRPIAPQNAEAWERANELIDRIDVQCRAVGRPVGGLEEIKFILRAALNQPRPPKIDGLQEAVAAYETEYWKARKAPRDQWAPFDFILEAARAQLAAQEQKP